MTDERKKLKKILPNEPNKLKKRLRTKEIKEKIKKLKKRWRTNTMNEKN